MNTLRNLFYVLVGVVLAIFIYSNFDQRVVVYFTDNWRTKEMSLAFALSGSLILGFLLAATLAATHQLPLRSRIRHMRRTVERLESELAELRKLPLDDSLGAKPAPPPKDTDSGTF